MSLPRSSRPGDEPGLRALWKAVFEDSDEFLDAFFTGIYTPGMASLIEEEGCIVSAAYALPLENALYLYAVGTLPGFRDRGCGRAVTLFAAGGHEAYLCPAEDGLRDWYAREMGAVTVSERPCTVLPEGELFPIGAAEYADAREVLLADRPHAVYPLKLLRFFESMGTFYRTSEGVCAIGADGTVREVLPGRTGGPFVMGLNGAPPLYFGLVFD